MSPLAKRILLWSAAAIAVVAVGYAALLVGNPNELEGKYSGYGLSGHEMNDVIAFENGLVTLKTCCGNTYYGDYMPKDDGWMWEHNSIWRRNPPQFRFPAPLKISVERKLFSATIRFEDGHTMSLRRRVFTRIPL